MRRIGIFGGTFDPIHIGHLIVGQEILCRCGLDRMLFVPSADPPHKTYPEMAPAEARAEMVALAVAGNGAFELSRIELERSGKSYTVETLRALSGQLGKWAALFLIIGADNVLDMPSWCRPEEVVRLAQVVVAARPGFDPCTVDSDLVRHMRFVQTPRLEISSTEIRARIRAGLSVRYLMPDPVIRYIQGRGLYR